MNSSQSRGTWDVCSALPSGQTVVLGLGNDLLTDDGVGLRVAAALRERLQNEPLIRVVESAEAGLALLDLIAGYETLVVVDAIQTGREKPGFVHEFELEALDVLPVVSPHFLGLGESLELARALGFSVPNRTLVFAVEVRDPFTVGTELSPLLQEALPEIIRQILGRLQELLFQDADMHVET